MRNNAIPDVGAMTVQTGAAAGGILKSGTVPQGKNGFGIMMKQAEDNHSRQFVQNSHCELGKNTENCKNNGSDKVSGEYEKYRYKDNTISEGREQTVSEENVKEELENFAQEVKNVLKEELGVSEEQIEQAMETLGLQFSQLLNGNQLAALVAELTGAGSMNELLCSDQFVTIMQSVQELGSELLGALGMTPEQFENAVNDALKQQETVPAAGMEQGAAPAEDAVINAADETVSLKQESGQPLNEPGTEPDKEMMPDQTDIHTEESLEHTVLTAPAEEKDSNSEGFLNQGQSSGNGNKFQSARETVPAAGDAAAVTQNQVLEQFAELETAANLPDGINTRNVIDQIVESARVIAKEHLTTMELQLNPENLGKMILKITEEEGAVSAKILTQNAIVKEALEAQVVELRQNLEQAGVKVDAVDVTVASHEFEKNLEQNAEGEKQQGEQQEKAKSGVRRLNLNDLSELSGMMSEEETLVAKMMAEQGNSVDYTA